MTNTNSADGTRRRQRRKEARPSEIVAAAIEVFADKGFGAAKMDEIARRAGVAKGTLFVYFPTKQDLFRAVAQTVVNANFERLQSASTALDRPLSELVPLLLGQMAMVGESRVASVIRLLIAEARAFPDLAQVWHDEVVAKVLGLVTSAIERAQARGEIRPGDARLYAFSIMGPILAGVIFREVFGDAGTWLPDLQALAVQHASIIIRGLTANEADTDAR
jgi:AcrR family transcriptional regulator